MDHEQKRLFRKNPKSLNKSSNSAVSHKLVVKNERPSSLSFEESQQSTLSFPGLSFIDSDSIDNGQAKLWLTSGSSKTKLSEEKVIESQPRRLNPVFKRELDSPTKSLQLELPPADDDHKETGVLGQRRSSSLCILALKTAVAKSQKTVTSPSHLRSSQASSLSSMISLPGVPPVQGVNDVQQVQLHRQKSSRQKQEKSSNPIINTSNSRLQSEEDLILSLHRKQEFKSMNSAKLKQEEDILSNIRKREMIDKLNKGDATDKRNKELVKKKLQENQQNYGIASGLLKTRNLLVAPITSFDHENHQDLIPPPASDHPNERRIVRWLKSATIQSAPELVVQAETRFSESPFVQECFQWHNQLRRRHLAPDLVLDAPLCATAQHWANMLAHKDEFYYQNPEDLGENLFAWLPPLGQQPMNLSVVKKRPDVSGQDAAMYWYKSHVNYDYEKEAGILHAHAAGSFTQMIWHSSTKFGCGKARSRSGKVIAVAYYQPKGNCPRQFHENVLPPAVIESEDDFDNGDDSLHESKTKYFRLRNVLTAISCAQ